MTKSDRTDETNADRRGSGEPGDGRGRRDELGGPGVYPASGLPDTVPEDTSDRPSAGRPR